MEEITLSIIIPTRNRAKYLDQCIKSILKSKFDENFEIIIIDDQSEDITRTYDKNYLIKKFIFNNIDIYHAKERLMAIKARNQGIKLSKAKKYILVIDDDNEIDEYMIKNLFNFAELNKAFGIIGPSMYYFDNKNKYLDYEKINFFTGRTKYVISEKNNNFYESDGVPNVYMIRTKLLQKYGLFDEKLIWFFEEPDFAFHLKKYGIKCCTIPEAITFHKVPSSSFNYKNMGGKFPAAAYFLIRNRFIIIKRYANIFQKFIFIVFFSWLWPLLYSMIIFIGSKRYDLIKLYWHGFKDGVYYFFTNKFRISINLNKLE